MSFQVFPPSSLSAVRSSTFYKRHDFWELCFIDYFIHINLVFIFETRNLLQSFFLNTSESFCFGVCHLLSAKFVPDFLWSWLSMFDFGETMFIWYVKSSRSNTTAHVWYDDILDKSTHRHNVSFHFLDCESWGRFINYLKIPPACLQVITLVRVRLLGFLGDIYKVVAWESPITCKTVSMLSHYAALFVSALRMIHVCAL